MRKKESIFFLFLLIITSYTNNSYQFYNVSAKNSPNSFEKITLNYLFGCYVLQFKNNTEIFIPNNPKYNDSYTQNRLCITLEQYEANYRGKLDLIIWGIYNYSINCSLNPNTMQMTSLNNNISGKFPFLLQDIPKNHEEYNISSYGESYSLSGIPDTSFLDLYDGLVTEQFGTVYTFKIQKQENKNLIMYCWYEKSLKTLMSMHFMNPNYIFPFLLFFDTNILGLEGSVKLVDTNLVFQKFINIKLYLLIGGIIAVISIVIVQVYRKRVKIQNYILRHLKKPKNEKKKTYLNKSPKKPPMESYYIPSKFIQQAKKYKKY